MIDDLRTQLDQILVQSLVQIQIKEHVPTPGAPSEPAVFAVVDVASNPTLLPLFDVTAQRMMKCLVDLGPERTALGRFGLLILGIDGDRTRTAAIKESARRDDRSSSRPRPQALDRKIGQPLGHVLRRS